MLTGDFDTHSKCWDPSCTELWEAAYWERIIDQHGRVIGNDDLPTHYWTGNERAGKSILDLTLANRPFEKWTILEGNDATGSDREMIEWEVDMEKIEEVGGTQVVGWNLVAIEQVDKEQVEKLWREQARGREYLGVESTGDDVESESEWSQEALGKVLDATRKEAWSQ